MRRGGLRFMWGGWEREVKWILLDYFLDLVGLGWVGYGFDD